jgi:ubiquinone/menaquinone biosynthesis C-methylase UbiE
VVRLLRQTFNAKRSKVHLPEQLPTRQEFHNLPNGNYSKNIAQGYARWLHGLADLVFDGINAYFVLHEIPLRYLHDVINEWQRIMCIGGRVAILEPSDVQWYVSWRKLWRDYGLAWPIF